MTAGGISVAAGLFPAHNRCGAFRRRAEPSVAYSVLMIVSAAAVYTEACHAAMRPENHVLRAMEFLRSGFILIVADGTLHSMHKADDRKYVFRSYAVLWISPLWLTFL